MKIEVRSGEAVEGNRIPMATRVTKSARSVTNEAVKNAMAEVPRRNDSALGDENPRRLEKKSMSGVSRSPLVPAAAIIDLSSAVP